MSSAPAADADQPADVQQMWHATLEDYRKLDKRIRAAKTEQLGDKVFGELLERWAAAAALIARQAPARSAKGLAVKLALLSRVIEKTEGVDTQILRSLAVCVRDALRLARYG